MNSPTTSTNPAPGPSSDLPDSRAPWFKPAAPFVTISRECSAGGSALAQVLARRLNDGPGNPGRWNIFGGNIVNEMLQNHRLPSDLARFLPEDRVPEVSATIGELMRLHPNLWDLVQKTSQTIRQLAREGQVIFVGRGANFVTAGMSGGVHVRLVAPAEHRAAHYARRFNVPLDQAVVHNRRCDSARRRYVATYFGADIASPAAYDLVINTAHVPLEEAADLVMAHLRAVAPVAA